MTNDHILCNVSTIEVSLIRNIMITHITQEKSPMIVLQDRYCSPSKRTAITQSVHRLVLSSEHSTSRDRSFFAFTFDYDPI